MAGGEDGAPYKGPRSYETVDAPLFYGRDEDARRLLAMVQTSPLSVLHAPSGAGKTSLLQARLLPQLERRGWLPVVFRVGAEPLREAVDTLQHAVLPALELERATLARALDALALPATVTLGALCEAVDAVPTSDGVRGRLLGPVPGEGGVPRTPWLVRLLRNTVDADVALGVLDQLRRATPEERLSGVDPTVARVLEALADPRTAAGHARWRRRLGVDDGGLAAVAGRAARAVEMLAGMRGVVLVFDQFEELFTRFADAGGADEAGAPRWHVKRDLFAALEALYRAAEVGGVPVRVVLSLRDDFLARLQPLREVVEQLDHHRYHLWFLEVDQVRPAVREPARQFGVAYTDDCLDRLVGDLAREGRWIEPGHLQLVLDRLWEQEGSALARAARDGGDATLDLLAMERGIGSVEQVLAEHLQHVLTGLEDDVDRVVALLMLDRLITPSGTRRPVVEEVLLQPTVTERAVCEQVLAALVDRAVVRRDHRLDDAFVEVTHEFLIGPILAALDERAVSDRTFDAIRSLRGTLSRADTGELTEGEYAASREVLPRWRVETTRADQHPAAVADLLLRAALRHERDPARVRLLLDRWLHVFEDGAVPLPRTPSARNLRTALQRASSREQAVVRRLVRAWGGHGGA